MIIGPIVRSILRSPAAAILIALQIALTLAIVSNAVYIISERIEKMNSSTGTVEDEIIYAALMYFGKETNEEHQSYIDLEALRSRPDIKSATYASAMPLGGSNSTRDLCTLNETTGEEECPYSASIFRTDETFIETLGLTLSAGRNFRPEEVGASVHRESPRAKVMIITQALADAYFPDGDAIGKTLDVSGVDETIIGVVERLQRPRTSALGDYPDFSIILPNRRHDGVIIVRAAPEDIEALKTTLASDLIKMNDRRVVHHVRTVAESRDLTYKNDRAMIYLLFGVIVLLVLITALGIAGLISFNVASRQKQIGTRRALGARKIDIVQYFLLENAIVSLIGLGFGAVFALMLNQFLIRHYQLSVMEPQYLAVALILVLLVSQVATLFPAIRGAQISPAIATRTV